ncbi:MAG TPA: hypothetical protein VHW00_05315 [Thermoanaerobaculia bacterium]|nr:hypothetical protein [Thermoanaerobaculia bacterium]
MNRWWRIIALCALGVFCSGVAVAEDYPGSGLLRLTGSGSDRVAFDRTWQMTSTNGTWSTEGVFLDRDAAGVAYPSSIRISFAASGDAIDDLGRLWFLSFEPADFSFLKPGTYQIGPENQSSFNLTAYAKNVILPRGCSMSDATGSFTIRTLQFECVGGLAHVTGLSATFERFCGGTRERATGEITFSSPKVGAACPSEAAPPGEEDPEPEPETPPVVTVPFQLSLPPALDIAPLPISNSGTQSIRFNTVVDSSTFDGDLHLSVTSDAEPHEDFTVSIAPSLIPKPGSGEAELTIKTGPMTFPRLYTVTVNATSDTQVSNSSFRVHVQCDPPFILGENQPKTITAQNGTQVQLDVTAGGTGPLFYQWFKGHPNMTFSPIAAAHEPTLIFTTRGTENYWVRVSNACGSVNSLPATVNTVGSLQGVARRRSGGN